MSPVSPLPYRSLSHSFTNVKSLSPICHLHNFPGLSCSSAIPCPSRSAVLQPPKLVWWHFSAFIFSSLLIRILIEIATSNISFLLSLCGENRVLLLYMTPSSPHLKLKSSDSFILLTLWPTSLGLLSLEIYDCISSFPQSYISIWRDRVTYS